MPFDTQNRNSFDQPTLDLQLAADEEPSADARTDLPLVRERQPQKQQPDRTLPRDREEKDRVQDHEHRGEPRKGLLRRHPAGFAVGLLVLFAALPFGYLYSDYASHFEYTDDAYHRGAPVRYRARGVGLPHSRPGH